MQGASQLKYNRNPTGSLKRCRYRRSFSVFLMTLESLKVFEWTNLNEKWASTGCLRCLARFGTVIDMVVTLTLKCYSSSVEQNRGVQGRANGRPAFSHMDPKSRSATCLC